MLGLTPLKPLYTGIISSLASYMVTKNAHKTYYFVSECYMTKDLDGTEHWYSNLKYYNNKGDSTPWSVDIVEYVNNQVSKFLGVLI